MSPAQRPDARAVAVAVAVAGCVDREEREHLATNEHVPLVPHAPPARGGTSRGRSTLAGDACPPRAVRTRRCDPSSVVRRSSRGVEAVKGGLENTYPASQRASLMGDRAFVTRSKGAPAVAIGRDRRGWGGGGSRRNLLCPAHRDRLQLLSGASACIVCKRNLDPRTALALSRVPFFRAKPRALDWTQGSGTGLQAPARP